MKILCTILLFPLVTLGACDSGQDSTGRDAPEATADRPAGAPDPAARTPGTADRDMAGGTVSQSGAPATPGTGSEEIHAVAEIMPTNGNEARGSIRLSGGNDTVKIAGSVTGLEPGAHGLHIHEFGDCSAPDASSAGEHFNPHDDPHGSPRDLENAHHVGDLGNITVNEQGEAEIDVEDNEIRLSGPESVIGKAVVVHSDQDDFESQPSGDSGARIGCGEIVESTATTG